MPDKKLTDNEIVKALECCKSDTVLCNECPYDKIGECIEKMCADSIDLINRQKAEIEQLQTLVNEMSDFFPACIGCEGKTTLGDRTDKCVYEIDNTNYCAKRGITNIAAIQKENRESKAEVERLKRELDLVIENSISARYPHCVLCGNGAILTKSLEEYDELIADISAEAYKEFAERLKEEINVRTTFSKEQDKNVLIYIDNILKELVGDDE